MAEYRWDPAWAGDGVMAVEASYAGPLELTCEPVASVWSHDIVTVAKSERELEQTVQGRSVTLRWHASAGAARVEMVTAPRPPA
ncbi:MAG: DUF1926 domain-containing protein [Gemmatimonadetes bacterium]|nr:DUF1926 domain-containing protein [Gemmatimonadota bacterium]